MTRSPTERELEQRRAALKDKGWIAVDLDGTLAEYHGWVGWNEIGKPIPTMVERVKQWLNEGYDVRVFTARVTVPLIEIDENGFKRFSTTQVVSTCYQTGEKFSTRQMIDVIQKWCHKHIGQALEVTCVKDLHMIELWDDRAVQIVANTGRTLAEEHEAELTALRGKVFQS